MVRDAETHAEEDKKRKEGVELRNEADCLAFRAEKALKDYKDKIPQGDRIRYSNQDRRREKGARGDNLEADQAAR